MAGFSVPIVREFYQGAVAANAQVTVYQSGTTTPVTVYADAGLTTPTTNPVVCDSNDEAVFYVSGTTALRLYATTSGGSLIRDIDPVYPVPAVIGTLAHGQCKLVKSGANLVLLPFNGNKLVINGTTQTIPSAGVSLAATGLVAGTVYNVFASMSGGSMILDALSTAHATDSATGVEIRSGDATRTLVGKARVVTGPAWQDANTQRFVRSWFNEPGVSLLNTFSTTRSTGNTSYVELNSEIRCEFLTWLGEGVLVTSAGTNSNNTNSQGCTTAIGVDGTSAEAGESTNFCTTGTTLQPFANAVTKSALTEDYHYATLLGKVSANTGTWNATSALAVHTRR